MTETVDLRLAATAENITLARLVARAVATTAGAPCDAVADLELAVSEAFTNTVRHAVSPAVCRLPRVLLRFEVEPGCVTVEADDDGPGFGATARGGREREPDGRGMGLSLIRAVTDELAIESGAHGSRVVFVKRFSAVPAG